MDDFVTIITGLVGIALLVMGITGGYNNLSLIGLQLPGAAETEKNVQTKQPTNQLPAGSPGNSIVPGWLPFGTGHQQQLFPGQQGIVGV